MRLRRSVAGAALTTVTASLLATLPLTAAQAVSADLVISQVYGAGGNTGATLNADYIEIFNRGTVPVSLAGLSLQYGSATGTGNVGNNTTATTELPDVTIPASGYFLVKEAGGANGDDFAADLTDPTPISMAAGAGKVALVRGTTSLGCNGGSAACSPDQLGRIVDLVGYGSANFYEGAGAAPTLSATAAGFRKEGGRTETDNNAADFVTGTPAPRNSGSVAPPPPPPPPPVDPTVPVLTIAEVQGAGAQSTYAGQRVTVQGIVTGDFQNTGGLSGRYGGIFVQSATDDGNAATSDGIRVFRNTPDVAVGDLVSVTGTVEEFASADSVYSGSETQFGSSSTVVKLGTAPAVPTPVELALPFAPTQDGVHGQERYEGMLVTVPAGLVATDLYTLGRFGELSLTTGDLLRIPATAEQNAANDADRIMIDDGLSGQNLAKLPYTVDEDGKTLPRAGDVLAEPVTGVMSYSFGFYRVEPAVGTTAGFERRNPRTDAPDAVGGDVQVASFNVLNYFVDFGGDNRGADNPAELVRQQAKLVSAITALDADVVGLIEIANDDGDALDTLVRALNAAQSDPADHYTAVDAPDINAKPTSLGGTYGTDAIRTAIIYRASVVTPAGPPPADAALLNPEDPGFEGEPLFDRPPAIQAFTEVGEAREFTVVVNHLKSKGSTNAQCGAPDEFGGNCDDLRERQAAGLVDLVEELGAEDALLLGDFNAYEAEAPIGVLKDAGYVSAAADLPTADRYSYSFDGEFGTLDYVFASGQLAEAVTGVDLWHINSAEAPAYDYNNFNQSTLYAPDAFASSDHDPELIGLDLDVAPVADAGGPYTDRVGKDVVLDASGSSDLNGDELSYAWDLDGDGQFDDAGTVTATFTKGRPPGYYPVAVQVSDGEFTEVSTTVITYTAANGQVPPGQR